MGLDNIDQEGLQLGYAEFIEFAAADEAGYINPEDFGTCFEIKADGVYIKRPPEHAWLMPMEHAALTRHPRGRPDAPALPFPFTLRELKAFFDWAMHAGYDVPINEKVLEEVIASQKIQPTLPPEAAHNQPNASDAALGAHTRQRNQAFAMRSRELQDARRLEHERWKASADAIQKKRQRTASKRELAKLVKQDLSLPDSIETIRRHI